MSLYVQQTMTTANHVTSKIINILYTSAQWRICIRKYWDAQSKTGGLTNSAGGIARPSCEQGITWSQAQAKPEESDQASKQAQSWILC